ncbi:hypothetical protein IJH46_01230 [Candidatus Saccharibacteria bacterium]|nr:hypothetical protein [Candidatus Saccharibacteria bacterium]
MTEPLLKLLDNFNPADNYDINGICNLYNALQFFKIFNDESKARYSALEQPIRSTINSFWSRVTNENFSQIIGNIDNCYFDDLVEMIMTYKVAEKVDEESIFKGLDEIGMPLHIMLEDGKFVSRFEDRIKNMIMAKPENAELLIQDQVKQVRSDYRYHIPDKLSKEDKLTLINRYLDSDSPNPNYVDLLAKKTEGFVLDDKTRLKAAKLSEKFVKKFFEDEKNSQLKYSVSVAINDAQNEPVVVEGVGTQKEKFIFSKKYLEENMCCGDILKIFSDILGYINYGGTLYLPSRESELSTLEKYMTIHGKKEYQKGIFFTMKNMEIAAKTSAYMQFLKKRGIDIVDTMNEATSTLLKDDFGVEGVVFNAPKSGDLLEKNRLMLIELDNTVRRFNLYTEELEVDEDLCAISSNTPKFDEIGTLMKKKYLEFNPKNEEIKRIQYLLFSDQSPLTYIDDNRKANNLIELSVNSHLKIEDFLNWQRPHVEFLVAKGILKSNSEGFLVPAQEVILLSEINKHGAIIYGLGNNREKDLMRSMEKKGWLVARNKLLSSDEANWFDYVLNSKKFNDGPELRNRYIHGVTSRDMDSDEIENDHRLIVTVIMSLLLKIVGELYILKTYGESCSD